MKRRNTLSIPQDFKELYILLIKDSNSMWIPNTERKPDTEETGNKLLTWTQTTNKQ